MGRRFATIALIAASAGLAYRYLGDGDLDPGRRATPAEGPRAAASSAPPEPPVPVLPERSVAKGTMAAAWERVRADPGDPAGWLALAEVQADKNQLEAAKQSYRTALRLGASDGVTHARLGFLLYADEQDEEALAALLEAKRRGAEVPLLDWTIEVLRQRAAGAADAGRGAGAPVAAHEGVDGADAPVEEALEGVHGPGEPADERPCVVAIERHPRNRAYLIEAEIDGVAGSLILDTGATRTVLTTEFAARASIEPDYAVRIRGITANGLVVQPTTVIDELTIADRTVPGVRVAVCETCEDLEADGLLGLDVQGFLGMQVDLAREAIRFADCGE